MRSKRLELLEAQQKKKPSTAKPRARSVNNGGKAKEVVTDAGVERLDAAASEEQTSAAKNSDGRRGKGGVSNAVGEIPHASFLNGRRAKEIVTDAVDEDAGGDVRDEETGTVDSWSDVRDEDANIGDTRGDAGYVGADSDQDADEQIADDEWLPTNSDQDADDDILDADGNGDMQFAEDQSLPTNSEENADMLGANERVNMQFEEAQSLPTNSDNVAGTRKSVIFDKYGRPCDVGSEVFASDIGRIVRAHCRPAIESWAKVPNSVKENIWKDIVMKYVVPEIYKPDVLLRANKAYKNWKRQLRVKMDKHETIAERKLNMPKRMIKNREDWESFVDFCNTDEDRKRRAIGKKAREGLEFLHSCGRKGIHRKIYDLEKDSPTGEVSRAAIFLDTHISKNTNDPGSPSISEIKMRLIKELVEANPDGQKDIGNDAVSLVCGRDTRGVVLGMGGGVSIAKVRASAASVETLRKAQQEIFTDQVDERLNDVDDMPDAGGDIRDEDTGTVDSWSDVRDVDADMLDTGSDAREEDAEIHDADGRGGVQFVEGQWLPTNSDEDADILGADGDSDVPIVEGQSLPTNSEKIADSSRKRKRDMVRRQVSDPHSESNNINCTNNGQGSTSMPSGTRKLVIFDKYGRPCDVGSEVFATDIGRIVRAHCRPAIESWTKVPNSMKENIWRDIVVKYVVPEIYKPNVLLRANKAYKTWKCQLRVEMDKHETIAERKINMPKRFIKNREDWESFVDFCNTDEDRKRRAIGKKAREGLEFLHSCGRKGIHRKIYDLEKESPSGEVSRAAIFLDTHIPKNINDPDSPSISDIKMRLIKELVEANPDGQKDIGNDAVTLVCGRDSRGVVLGMGGGVSITKVRASAASVEYLRKVQQENKSLQSDIHLLQTQYGLPTPNHTTTTLRTDDGLPTQNYTSTPYTLSASDVHSLRTHFGLTTPNHTSTPSIQSAPPTQNRISRPSNHSATNIQNCTTIPSNLSASQAPGVSNLPARSRFAPDVSNLPAHSRLAPDGSNSPARSCLAPPASNLPASSCFIKNFKGGTIALGSINAADPPMENVYSLVIEEIFDRNAELFDEDGKLGDVMIGGLINWPKACVEFNFPANSCFIRNFRRKSIAFGSFSAADPPTEHVYSITIKEIYDRDAELFDEDGKLGDVMIGGVINWPKACVKPC